MSWYRKPPLSPELKAYRAKHAQLSYAEIKALNIKAENWLKEYVSTRDRRKLLDDPTFVKAKARFDILNELYNIKFEFEQAERSAR